MSAAGDVSAGRAGGGVSARGRLIAAWVAVGLIPVGLVVAIVVGSFLGGPEPETAGVGVILTAAVVAVGIMLIAPIAAIVLGERARRAGARWGLAPLIIGIVTAAWAVLSNTIPVLLALLIAGGSG